LDLFSKAGKRVAVAAFLLAAVFVADAFSAEVFINVGRRKGALIRIAVAEFRLKSQATEQMQTVNRKLGKEAKSTLSFDLNFTGYFEAIDNNESIRNIRAKEEKTGKPDWKAWADLGADSLLKGEYSVDADGNVVMDCFLFDVARKEQILGERYKGNRKIFRRIIHKFGDEVLRNLTGDKGIADTRVALTVKNGKNKEVFLVDYDGRNLHQVSNENSLVLSPAWSPDGTKIMFTTYRDNNPDIFYIDLVTGKRYPIIRRLGLNMAGAWMPDSKKIVFTMSRRGNPDIYLMGADGKHLKRLTYTRSIETSPTISPDGEKIAYVSDFTGKPNIYIMDINGENKKRFTYGGKYNADPAWSPKGDMIAYTSLADGLFDIIVKKVTGRFKKQLTIFAGNNESPSWSPNGAHLVFRSNRTGSRQLFIMNANGDHQTQITNFRGEAFTPDWGPWENN